MFTVRHKFSIAALYQQRTESLQGFLSKRWSFWLALFSCIAFLIGNMVGQHGFQAFWKSVWGQEQIVFDGTVMPIAMIPDPERWAGDRDRFSYADVPESLLVPLPSYRVSVNCEPGSNADHHIFSVAYLGDYEHAGEGCGSHLAVDILAPKGTPVRAIANGIVERVEERNWGYGNTIVITHPNVPDPDDPKKHTTLYSGYAHLGRMLVQRGEIVRKGQEIAYSGQTGFATTPHLHFQIDRENAPFHPYWPFTTAEATAAGLSFIEAVNEGLGREQGRAYTVNPLLYVQEYLQWDSSGMIAQGQEDDRDVSVTQDVAPVPPPPKTWQERAQERREQKAAARQARRSTVVLPVLEATQLAASSSLSPNPDPHPTPVTASIAIVHDGSFDGRAWEQLILFARDAGGNFLSSVQFEGTLTLSTIYGAAEFSPASLTATDFDEHGRSFVRMLPRGMKTIVPSISGTIEAAGAPMVFALRDPTFTTVRGRRVSEAPGVSRTSSTDAAAGGG